MNSLGGLIHAPGMGFLVELVPFALLAYEFVALLMSERLGFWTRAEHIISKEKNQCTV